MSNWNEMNRNEHWVTRMYVHIRECFCVFVYLLIHKLYPEES